MKVCSKCKEEKEITEFWKNKKFEDGYARICKICASKESQSSYFKTSGKRNKYLIDRRRKIKNKFDEFKKTLSCSNCEENHPATLDFHHINPNTKYSTISDLKWSGCSKETLQAELKKCIVLCSNCHRKLHYEEKIVE